MNDVKMLGRLLEVKQLVSFNYVTFTRGRIPECVREFPELIDRLGHLYEGRVHRRVSRWDRVLLIERMRPDIRLCAFFKKLFTVGLKRIGTHPIKRLLLDKVVSVDDAYIHKCLKKNYRSWSEGALYGEVSRQLHAARLADEKSATPRNLPSTSIPEWDWRKRRNADILIWLARELECLDINRQLDMQFIHDGRIAIDALKLRKMVLGRYNRQYVYLSRKKNGRKSFSQRIADETPFWDPANPVRPLATLRKGLKVRI